VNARTKAKNDMALNLTELAQVTGYGRSSLQAMKLPLICGKMRLRDFWRNMQYRQAIPSPTPTSAFPVTAHSMLAIADKFRAPRSKNGQPTASPSRAARPVRNNG
jgi:hypothetical protein